MIASMESKQTNYTLYILYATFKFSIDFPNNSTEVLPENKHN